jgi:hypothetical protein
MVLGQIVIVIVLIAQGIARLRLVRLVTRVKGRLFLVKLLTWNILQYGCTTLVAAVNRSFQGDGGWPSP